MVLEKILNKGSSLIEFVIEGIGIWNIQVKNDLDNRNNDEITVKTITLHDITRVDNSTQTGS